MSRDPSTPDPARSEEEKLSTKTKILRRAVSNKVKRKYLDFMEAQAGVTAYKAWKKFRRDHPNVTEPQVRQWAKKKEKILSRPAGSRVSGGGRHALCADLEEILFEFIFHKRMKRERVTRAVIRAKAIELGRELGLVGFNASTGWLRRFLFRHDLTLRHVTNLTRLCDLEVITRGVNYLTYLQCVRDKYRPSDIISMDETALCFETTSKSTIDVQGAQHVPMRTTGFASMRITAVLAVRANGTRVMPTTIFKGKREHAALINGCYTFRQKNGWVDSALLCEWLGLVLPRIVRGGRRGLVIWDSCRSHISAEVKSYCKLENIDLAVIPGGMTPYLQAGHSCYYKVFNDILNSYIEDWKDGPLVEYTKMNNPRPPKKEIVNTWVRESWRAIDEELVRKGLRLSGITGALRNTYIANHDIYGENFLDAVAEREAAECDFVAQVVQPDDDDELVVEDNENSKP